MRLSRTVTGTALLLKRRTPWLYTSIRNNTPHLLRSLINEQMDVDSLGSDDPKLIFTNIFQKNWWNNSESRSDRAAELRRTVSTHPNARRNTNIRFGQVRHLNLCAPPFNLPEPFKILREDDDPQTGRVIGSGNDPTSLEARDR